MGYYRCNCQYMKFIKFEPTVEVIAECQKSGKIIEDCSKDCKNYRSGGDFLIKQIIPYHYVEEEKVGEMNE